VRNEGGGWRKKSLRPPAADGKFSQVRSSDGVKANVACARGGAVCVPGPRAATLIRPGWPLVRETATTWEYADGRSRLRSAVPRIGAKVGAAGRAEYVLNSLEPAAYPERIRIAGRFVRADVPVIGCIRFRTVTSWRTMEREASTKGTAALGSPVRKRAEV
jgi:hypothetical protein